MVLPSRRWTPDVSAPRRPTLQCLVSLSPAFQPRASHPKLFCADCRRCRRTRLETVCLNSWPLLFWTCGGFEQQFDVAMQVIDTRGRDLRRAFGFGENERAL